MKKMKTIPLSDLLDEDRRRVSALFEEEREYSIKIEYALINKNVIMTDSFRHSGTLQSVVDCARDRLAQLLKTNGKIASFNVKVRMKPTIQKPPIIGRGKMHIESDKKQNTPRSKRLE